jgi:hypothetical protein
MNCFINGHEKSALIRDREAGVASSGAVMECRRHAFVELSIIAQPDASPVADNTITEDIVAVAASLGRQLS